MRLLSYDAPKVTVSKTNKGLVWAQEKFNYRSSDNVFLMRKISNSNYEFIEYTPAGAGFGHWLFLPVINVVKESRPGNIYDLGLESTGTIIVNQFEDSEVEDSKGMRSVFEKFKKIFTDSRVIDGFTNKAIKELSKEVHDRTDFFFECGYKLATKNGFVDITKAI